MNYSEVIISGIQECRKDLLAALDGLTYQERRFQPKAESNHIDFLIWHIARVEDEWIQVFGRNAVSVWIDQKWHTRLGLPEKGAGTGYSPADIAQFPIFDLNELLEYYGIVRSSTLDFITNLPESDLSTIRDPLGKPNYTTANMLGHVLVEQSMHMGQVAYLRGLQKGLNQ